MQLFSKTEKLMGNRFVIGVVCDDAQMAEEGLSKAVNEIKRIEQLLSTYQSNSQINQINDLAGIAPQKVDLEVFQLIQRAQKISEITQGAFDLTYGSIDKSLWNFDQSMTQLPSADLAKKSVELIDFRHIELNAEDQTVFLKRKGMRMGFGGIGKGYAADCAKKLLVSLGFENGLVNASGDMCAWGTQETGETWKIGIAHPDDSQKIFAEFDLKNSAAATSGNYEKFVWIDGVKYSHTIHPKTGFPIHGIKSVTVLAPFAELADVLTTPIAVMGIEVALDLINQIEGVACVIIDDDNKIYTSKNISLKEHLAFAL
ncbi:MAG: FAD:protein FMN transferase [Aquirufa sp.]